MVDVNDTVKPWQPALSILDLAIVARGETPADAFSHSVEIAQRAEARGYRRVWYAEHHNMSGIASAGDIMRGLDHGLKHLKAIAQFQQFAENIGVVPTYLIDWPIATSARAQEMLGDYVRRGKAEIGIQLHPWVNPPFEEKVNAYNSYAGNLPPDLEEAKYRKLRDKIEESFGTLPRIYRAGRYGLGPQTTRLLSETGIAIDSSVRANFDYSAFHGPDYSRHPLTPYWTDAGRKLIELPPPFGGGEIAGVDLLQPVLARELVGAFAAQEHEFTILQHLSRQ